MSIQLKRILVEALVPTIILAGLASVAAFSQGAQGATETYVAPPPSPTAEPEPIPPLEPVSKELGRSERLATYVLGVMQSWPRAQIEAADYEDVARTFGWAAATQAPAWADDTTGAKTADLIAGIAWFESGRYAAYVVRSRDNCNDWMHRAWGAAREVPTGTISILTGKPLMGRLMPELGVLTSEQRTLLHYGSCDGGLAHGLGQIHAMSIRMEDGSTEDMTDEKLRDQNYNVAMMLMLARRSMRAYGDLHGYTGEPASYHPKADDRLRFALDAYAKHPFSE